MFAPRDRRPIVRSLGPRQPKRTVPTTASSSPVLCGEAGRGGANRTREAVVGGDARAGLLTAVREVGAGKGAGRHCQEAAQQWTPASQVHARDPSR